MEGHSFPSGWVFPDRISSSIEEDRSRHQMWTRVENNQWLDGWCLFHYFFFFFFPLFSLSIPSLGLFIRWIEREQERTEERYKDIERHKREKGAKRGRRCPLTVNLFSFSPSDRWFLSNPFIQLKEMSPILIELHPLNIDLSYLFDRWTTFSVLLLLPHLLWIWPMTDDHLYRYFLDNEQTANHQSLTFSLPELNSTAITRFSWSKELLTLTKPVCTRRHVSVSTKTMNDGNLMEWEWEPRSIFYRHNAFPHTSSSIKSSGLTWDFCCFSFRVTHNNFRSLDQHNDRSQKLPRANKSHRIFPSISVFDTQWFQPLCKSCWSRGCDWSNIIVLFSDKWYEKNQVSVAHSSIFFAIQWTIIHSLLCFNNLLKFLRSVRRKHRDVLEWVFHWPQFLISVDSKESSELFPS